MTDEKKDTENDKNDAVNTVADTKQAKPKQKKKQKKQRNPLFAKYVPPVIEHKKVKPKQNDYDTVFAEASSHGVTGCVYVRGLAGAAILASFVYSSVNVLTYGFTHDVFFSIAQSAFLFLAAFAASSIALIYAERFLQANLAAMSDGQYAAFLDQEEAIRGLVGNPEEHAGKAASKAFVQSLLVAIAGIILGTMIPFPTVSAAIAVFLLIGLAPYPRLLRRRRSPRIRILRVLTMFGERSVNRGDCHAGSYRIGSLDAVLGGHVSHPRGRE